MPPIANHPAAAEFPMMDAARYADLKADIQANGLRIPIVLCDGMILDGRNRYRACLELGIKPKTEQIKSNPFAAVWSLNGQRRDIEDGTRAQIFIHVMAQSAQWQERQAEAKAKANIKRSETQKGVSKAVAKERAGTPCSATLRQKNADHPTACAAAKASGTNAGAIKRAITLEAKAPEAAAKVRAGEISQTAAYRQVKEAEREQKRQANAVLVSKAPDPLALESVYSTILADPPWDWGDEGDVNQLGRAKPDYAAMPVEKLMDLPVARLADKNAHLYLWITNRSLPKGFALIERWGFRFITMLTWAKPSFGMGNYFRGQTEHILFAVCGSLPLKRKDASTLLPAWARGKNGHSSKPAEIHEFIESCSPGPYLELFARTKREGWTVWGADA